MPTEPEREDQQEAAPERSAVSRDSASVRPGQPASSLLPRVRAPDGQDNPFESLPFPNPGDRIRADDFKALSQGLLLLRDAFGLSGALFGQTFGQAKQILAARQYRIQRVMTVFGTEIDNLGEPSLDNRKVIQVLPVEFGEWQVAVILTEAVETRRFTPNLMGLTYEDASERLRAVLGDVTFPGAPVAASQLVGLTLTEAKEALPK